MRRKLVLGSTRELGTVGAVAGLAGAYAGALLTCSTMLSAMSTSTGGSVSVLVAVVSVVLIGMALYVAAVVISAGVATVIAGRLRQIATLRLLGAKSSDLRHSIAISTARICLICSMIGVTAATFLVDVVRMVLVHEGHLPRADYPMFSFGTPAAVAAITAAAAVAGWAGSRQVLEVSPADALAGSIGARSTSGKRVGGVRIVFSAVLMIGGTALFALSMVLGERGVAAGFLVAFFAACVTSTGLLAGARFVLPAGVGLLGRLTGVDAASVIARRNAVADPARTTRSTLGLFVGVALVVTIASGTSALQTAVGAWHGMTVAQRHEAHNMLSVASTVAITVGVVSSLIAATGFVSTMSLTVIQRRRELGLLRALGFTGPQVRSMITKESVAMSAAATSAGVVVGICYGSASAQALVGSETDGFVWGLPWLVLVAIVLAAMAVILLASQPPARRSIATPPVSALRVEN